MNKKLRTGRTRQMRNFFKKKTKSIELFSPSQGEIIPIERVPDEVFSSKMMGDGFAVKPIGEELFSPVCGEVISVFPTKHAIAVKSLQNLEVLIHIGIDTVELQGAPFQVFVEVGEKVTPKSKLAKVDLSYLKEKNKPTDIMVILTNMSELGGNLEGIQYGNHESAENIGKVSF